MIHTHNESFKEDAVRIALTSRFTRWQVAADLGIELWLLNRWIREYQHGPELHGVAAQLADEIAQLQTENDALRAELNARSHRPFQPA